MKRKRSTQKNESCDNPAKTTISTTTAIHHLDHPVRDTELLFASRQTLECAHGCVPCGYKIGLFDVSLDTHFCQRVPNQRPEQCPRAGVKVAEEPAMGYRAKMNVLTLGDGDLSFSLALARVLKPKENKSILVATSYERKETLMNLYPNFQEILSELEALGASVCFKVDATRIKETLSVKIPIDFAFHRICWNFPCTAIAKGQDGQNKEMERNKELVRRFVGNAMQLLHKGCGEIHICHKTKPPYNQWKLELVALENNIDTPHSNLRCAGRVVLDRYILPPYIPRKALDRKSFPCHDACFYVFVQRRDDHNSSYALFPPTIDANNLEAAVVPVSTSNVLSIRESLLKNKWTKKKKM